MEREMCFYGKWIMFLVCKYMCIFLNVTIVIYYYITKYKLHIDQ